MKKRVIRVVTTLFAIMLTAKLGRIDFQGHSETWYNLSMNRVLARAEQNGFAGDYWERADGCKMLDKYIICAGHPSRYGEIIETSRGLGIILDTGDFVKNNPTGIDIATTW